LGPGPIDHSSNSRRIIAPRRIPTEGTTVTHPFRNLIARLYGRVVLAAVLLACNAAWATDMVPYLQTPTATSIWVSWKTSTPGSSIVEYGTSESKLDRQASGSNQQLSSNYFFHGVQLSGLAPDSFYYYRVRTATAVSDVFRFRTQPDSSKVSGKYRILVAGDHQIRDQSRYLTMLNAARAKIESLYGQPLEEVINIVINDGDQVDVGTLDHYENLHFRQSEPLSKNVPIMTTIGNHEVYYDNGMTNWKAHFFIDGINYKGNAPGPDERYYANHVGRVLFIHLDSEAPTATQKEWARSVITAADADPQVDWVISVVHRPYQAEQYVGDISGWFRDQVMPILSVSRKHVLNVAGHHHLYARGQTREWPTYHMISGGTAWDQYWGQSTETDFDDVQKTIANWTWQLVEIDVATKEMTVRSYSEAHPRLGFVYTSRQTDEFHRNLNHGAPEKPQLTNTLDGPVTLPYTFTSSDFESTFQEELNSTQFQFSRNDSFTDLVVDSVRDYENIYGDTGAPDYEPVDINAGLDIMAYEVPEFGLPNGDYFVRVRHRDRNVEWSPWSDSRSFKVEGSTTGAPSLSVSKRAFAPGEKVRIDYANGYGKPKDWIGVYKAGQKPGSVTSQKFAYVPGPNGHVEFSGLAAGVEYYAAFFTDDGYTEIADRVNFYVGSIPVVSINKTELAVGETAGFSWSNAPGGAKDWIGIYRVGQEPGQTGSTQYKYVPSASGSVSFSGLAKGYYYAGFFVNDGYFELIDRIGFSVGDRIATVSMARQALEPGEDFDISFADGPGIPKDYIGIFRLGDTPGVDKLIGYYYFEGKASGSVRVTDDLADGNYFAAMYTNDSYTEVSNRVEFSVGDAQLPPPAATMAVAKGEFFDTEAVVLNWANTPGGAKDWIGIYRKGQTPGTVNSVKWTYAAATSGSASFSGLATGEYFAAFLLNDGYTEGAPRVAFKVVKLGDINGDGKVDVADRNAQRAAMGSCAGDARYVAAANFDSDSCITQQDYKLWYAIYTQQ
jgi:hypothetical protein